MNILGDGIYRLLDILQHKKGFSSEFGKETDISSRFNKGFVISKHRKLTRRRSFENLLISGPTGSGKTQRLLLKNLYELKNCSIVVNDPSKEIYNYTSKYLSEFFEIQTLNFSDSSISSGYNILSRIKKSSDINKISHMLVASTLDKGGGGDAFWSLQTKTVLNIFIRLVLYQKKEYQNMANVLYILNCFIAEPIKVDSWIVATGDKRLILEYKTLVAIPEKTLQNIMASAKASLQLFEDEEISKVTASDTIDFDRLRLKPTIVFLHNNIADMKYVSILNGIVFEQLYGHILQKIPEKKELDLFIILEECSSLYIPVLPTAMANTRKHRVGNIICVQSAQSQLKTFYHDDAVNIINNCVTKIYMPGQSSMDILRDLETYSGKTIHKDAKGIERIKALITADEIRLLHENRTLILCSNNPIIKGRTAPCYRSSKYKKYMDMPPLPFRSDVSSKSVLMLD
jgi:type IV secretory pathway TraG/TraD family ATPase VirD4